jgi:hypothetical protein
MSAEQQLAAFEIDLTRLHRRTVSSFYSNLVTRPTGRAVRLGVEQQLLASGRGGTCVSILDFSQVRVLDYSCADEIVAKLLLKYCDSADGARPRVDGPRADGYFVFRGINDSHLDAIEAVLEHHGLALVVDRGEEGAQLVGMVGDGERRAWETVHQLGAADAGELADAAGMSPDDASRVLDTLCRRRLLMRLDDVFVPIGIRR